MVAISVTLSVDISIRFSRSAGVTRSIAGIPVAIVGVVAAFFLFKLPPANFIGEERVKFVRELLALFADIAPQGQLKLAAQLDARLSLPAAELPSGSDNALVVQEKKEAWLSGASRAIPGLRLAWQVIEWRNVKLVRPGLPEPAPVPGAVQHDVMHRRTGTAKGHGP